MTTRPSIFDPDATDAMLDLETMGTDPYCPVLSIGACAFQMEAGIPIQDTFYQAIQLSSCMELGLRPSASTMLWWMQRERAAQAVMFDERAVTLPVALDAFTEWWQSRPMNIWGNSARFDCGILEAAYKVCGKQVPWPFWKEQCYRTIKTLPGAKDVPFKRIGVHHHALDDALSQAAHLRLIMKHLKLTK